MSSHSTFEIAFNSFQAKVQDVCIFCAFRSATFSNTQVARRRYLGTSSSARRQNTGAAFKHEDDDVGFGGLADEVDATQPSPPPPPPSSQYDRPANRQSDPQPYRPPIRYETGGRNYSGPSSRTFPQRRQNEQSNYAHAGPRSRRVDGFNRSVSAVEANVDAATTARWVIGKKTPASTAAASPSADRPAQPQHRQQFERVPPTKAESPLPRSPSYRSWTPSSDSNTGYVPFDSRFSGAFGAQRSDPPRAVPRPNAPAFTDASTSHQTQSKVGWQPSAPPARHTTDSEAKVPSWSRRAAGNEGPRITRHSVDSQSASEEHQAIPAQQFDEYGFPIESSTADANAAVQQSSWQSSPSASAPKDSRARNERSTRRTRERRDEDDFDRRGHDRKKGRASRTQERDNDDFDVEEYHRKKRERQAARVVARESTKAKQERRVIRLPDFIRVGSLANELGLRYGRFAQILEKYGFDDVNSDFVLSAENAALIADEAGFTAVTESQEPDDDLYAAPLPEDLSVLPQRPPVVTIMGHVDHGKTTILDYMRKSSIVASEHGGITQHIGAFSVPMPSGKTITFLDTPGHAAFLSMRQRGANVTDIVILVVAADDSVMPQTLEAIKHAKAAQVPIIVAMNKIDKPEAKPDQVKQDLARHGVDIEDYGGDVQVVQVSGKTGQGMPDLEEAIVALSEIQDQRAPIDGTVEGWVLESSTKEVGKVATVLIRRGTLRSGDIIVAGTEYCRVRTMRDEFGNQIPEAGPGMPAEIDGWRGQPKAGDEVLQALDEQVAQDVTKLRDAKLKRADLGKDVEAINEQRKAHQIKHEREKSIERAKKEGLELPEELVDEDSDATPGVKNVYFIVKGDVAGSVEAVVNSIAPLGTSEVRPVVLKSAVGTITQSDIDHATASGGQLISFNTAIPPTMRAMAERAGTKILDHNIIYRLVDDVKASLEDMLPAIIKSRVLGEAEVAQIFEINQKRKKVKIAGCKVRNGTIMRNAKVKVLRGLDNEVVYTGKSLARKPFSSYTC